MVLSKARRRQDYPTARALVDPLAISGMFQAIGDVAGWQVQLGCQCRKLPRYDDFTWTNPELRNHGESEARLLLGGGQLGHLDYS
jgi:hypothetical protein